ncbi:MAG: hypothetical protein WAV38_31235 [Xanthobacteraceae bacterium]
MFSRIKIAALSAAVVLSTAFPALAAIKHQHRVTHAHSAIYNMVPDTGCPANVAAHLAVTPVPQR